jgi:peptide/nickel transport system permease protein
VTATTQAGSQAAPAPELRRRSWRLRRIRVPSWVVVVAAAIPILIVVLGFLLPTITGYSTSAFVAQPLQAPSWAHPFGTDQFGRDILVRCFAASHIDYLVAVVGVGISATLGSLIGVAVASTRLKWVDWAVMRIADAVIAFPFIVLALAFVVVFGSDTGFLGLPQGMPALFAAFLLVGWAYYARLARSQAVSLRSRDFVTAARLMGYSNARISLRHVMPIVMATTMAYAVGDAIITVSLTASLSFLGAGIGPPAPEWGQMMFDGRSLLEIAWWMTLFPALLLVVSGLCLAIIADHSIKRIEDRA